MLSFANRVKGLGLHTALVQQRGDITEAANACFFINGALTAVTYVLILVMSPLASRFFDDPRAGAVLAVMSLRLFPQALSAVPTTLAVRELDFRLRTLILLADGLVSAAVSVGLALLGWGPWSLVAGSLGGSFIDAVLWWVLTPWRPSRRLNREKTRQIVHFGIRLWSSGNLAYLIDSCSRLFVGGFLGLTLGPGSRVHESSAAQPGSLQSTTVPAEANMPPTPWHTEILASFTWAGAVPRSWRTPSCSAYMPYMPECM